MLLESHLCVTGTTKQNGKSPFYSCTMSYTTASASVLLRATFCQLKAAQAFQQFLYYVRLQTLKFLGSILAIKLL